MSNPHDLRNQLNPDSQPVQAFEFERLTEDVDTLRSELEARCQRGDQELARARTQIRALEARIAALEARVDAGQSTGSDRPDARG
jgi:hypothetical protein